jgi:hypothetical protein
MEVFRLEAMEAESGDWSWVMIDQDGVPRFRSKVEWPTADEALVIGILAVRRALEAIARDRQRAFLSLADAIVDEPVTSDA